MFYQILRKLVKYSLHTGQRLGSKRFKQSKHKILCPQGNKACVLSASVHIIHLES